MASTIRFAALIRVSTEKQEQRGESLRTQTKQIEQAVASVGGTIAKTYAGQEHATSGHERMLLEEMLKDAQAEPRTFDAVMVADATRWSRDNVASESGLEILRDAGVRFFVLGTEHNLFEPEARLFLGLSSTIGAYHARTQKQKSMLNKIERAKRGIPTGGKLPFGRTWDKKREQWGIDETKRLMVVQVAERYLAGESLKDLAKEYGVNHANLCKILRERCGSEWMLQFAAPDLNINETVSMTIPALLDDDTIAALQDRLQANRTYLKKPSISKYDYLLRGRVHCAQCGTVFTGQMNQDNQKLYYRHRNLSIKASECPHKRKPWVPAQWLETRVLETLLRTLGNVAQLEGAIKRATPQYDDASQDIRRIQQELTKLEEGKQRLIRLVATGAVDEADTTSTLQELKERATLLHQREAELTRGLGAASIIEEPEWHCMGFWLNELKDDQGQPLFTTEQTVDKLTQADRHRLIEYAFGQALPNGGLAGVYVTAHSAQRKNVTLDQKFTLEIRGQVAFTVPVDSGQTFTWEACDDEQQEEGDEETVIPHAKCSRARVLPARHSYGSLPPPAE